MALINFGDKNQSLDVSLAAILKIAAAIIIFYSLYLVRDILLWVLFGLIISVLFDPAIDFLQKFRISRPLAVFLVYFTALGLFGWTIYLIAPILIAEIQQFSQLFPLYFEKFSPYLSGLGFEVFSNMEAFTSALRDWLINASSSIFSSIASIFGGIFLTLTIFTIAIFFSLEEKGIERLIELAMPKKYEKMILNIWKRSQIKIAGWFATRFIGMAFIGIAVWLACSIFNVKYPILFGFLSGIADIVPFIGPLIAGAIVALFALLESWQTALVIIAIFIIIHQIESNLLLPLLARKFLEFPAILVLISIFLGDRLWGVAGAVLAIPLFGIIFDFTRDFLEKNKD